MELSDGKRQMLERHWESADAWFKTAQKFYLKAKRRRHQKNFTDDLWKDIWASVKLGTRSDANGDVES
jgi:hypothetical protein